MILLTLFYGFLVGVNIGVGIFNISEGRSTGALNLGTAGFIAFVGAIVVTERRR